MTDTPRTDAEAVTFAGGGQYVPAHLAREMERDLRLLVRLVECLPLSVALTNVPGWGEVRRIIEATKGHRHD